VYNSTHRRFTTGLGTDARVGWLAAWDSFRGLAFPRSFFFYVYVLLI
jgi:hypothetical protein